MASSSSSSSPEFSAAPTATTSQCSSAQYSHLSREEVLEELSSRFILNLPEEELASLERVCFQVEQAHWYYEDFIREQNPSKFPSYSLKTFSEALFKACPLLHQWASDHDRTFQSFMQYKTRVPVCGAIMLNDTWEKCLLVKGWKSSAGWGFPKGKINEQEPRPRCAAREVLEETGYDLEGQIVPENVIQLSIKEQSISLYIVPGVPEDFPFKTRTRKEISKIAWFKLADLPTWKRSKSVPGKFYLITPFIGPLKAFIHDRKPLSPPRKVRKAPTVQVVQDIQLSSDDDSAATLQLQSTLAIEHDSNAQESSSQSSSADNGEPQTPSPQYSAPRINESSGGSSGHIPDDPTAQSINIDAVDPQLARLLSSLTMSASVSHGEESTKSDSSTVPHQSHLHQAPRSAQRPTGLTSMARSPPPSSQDDWSSHVPGPPPSSSSPTMRPSSHNQPDQSSFTVMMSHSQTSPYPPSHAHRHSTSSRPDPTPSSQINAHTSIGLQYLPLDTSPTTASRASHARHSSATADISPYLSRARNIPTGKEMRYISMLENVAKESDRMASNIGQLGGPIQPGMMQMGGRSSIAPAPPASVPPMMMGTYGHRMESPIIYSSAPAASTLVPSARPPMVSNMSQAHGISGDDPFTVRPHTSNHFHMVPTPQSHVGMYGDQMRRMVPVHPGVQSMGLRHSAFVQPPSYPGQYYPNPPMTMPAAMPLPRDAQPPLRVLPQHYMPTPVSSDSGQPLPSTSPSSFNLLARNNASRAANNAQLLSILNSPSSAARAGPAVMDVHNSLGPR